MPRMRGRPVLLLLPGLLCDAEVWRSQCAEFASTHEVVVADYGACRSLPDMARAAIEQVNAHSLFAVAGHSMGGRVALELHRLVATRITHLALMDTGCKALTKDATGLAERSARLDLLALARSSGMRAMAKKWATGMVLPAQQANHALMESIYAMLARKTPELFAAQIEALLNRPDASDVLRAVRCPALILCGDADLWSPFDQHVAMAGLTANAKLIAIAASGHMVTMERPQAVNAAMRAWLAITTARFC
jgi:pimeloyl-ACP methyl ester carboxylesterase